MFTAILILVLSSSEVLNGTVPPSHPEVQVPFGCGLAFPVSQAHHVGSHQSHDGWAWDFRMPEGVPVVAARAGRVRLARGDSQVGGCDPRFAPDANYVVVSHGDGLETQYLHFQSVMVEPGAWVEAGDLLGYSGKTGWACGAHLHFKVAREEGTGWNNPSIPAHISGYGDPDFRTWVVAPACSESQELVQQASAPTPAPSASKGGSGPKSEP